MKPLKKEELTYLSEEIVRVLVDTHAFYERTPHRLLDIFPKSLTTEEAEKVSFAYEELHLKHEYKHISFFKQLYNDNVGSPLIVEIDYQNIDAATHLNILEVLDRYEQFLWIEQLVKIDVSSTTNFFEVTSFETLKMLLQVNTREAWFCNFHFLKLDLVIRGHYDLSMEMFFKHEEQIKHLQEKAQLYNLFIRHYPED
ncbi:hypothetical protein SAMN04488134_103256 [Amphibacillus marinus]|uniref:Uncharacterized protein n=1 Tax=Amphibacillus marinus TaxID=872970 RepID=A0A1H8LMS6_9BACI|nr:hypothetical protein [Amphibacillus marinus]SEO06128.1 hypothetical protein SAMN04488134_103256 [Amphibacillus marinus]